MESPYLQIIVTAIASILITMLGGGGVVLWWLNRRKHTAEAEKEEISVVSQKVDLLSEFETKLKEKLDESDKRRDEILEVKLKAANTESMLQIAEGNLKRYEKLFEQIYTEKGKNEAETRAAIEREQQCRKGIAQLQSEREVDRQKIEKLEKQILELQTA